MGHAPQSSVSRDVHASLPLGHAAAQDDVIHQCLVDAGLLDGALDGVTCIEEAEPKKRSARMVESDN